MYCETYRISCVGYFFFQLILHKQYIVYFMLSQYSRQGEPYSNCTDRQWLDEVFQANSTFGDNWRYVYTDKAAVGLCEQQQFMK